ncbi:hypothetical protein BU16DRAFT_45244 [Lophium mytilinum]|uniref:Uncharacterized protein n=1 Tax=Lophium mytilinum TaxID=390894 RepID=A0A6A6QQJ2_9PEZI|nr:hypothetical protein BU16DRAFT_45244 [Lophium mytilinum]
MRDSRLWNSRRVHPLLPRIIRHHIIGLINSYSRPASVPLLTVLVEYSNGWSQGKELGTPEVQRRSQAAVEHTTFAMHASGETLLGSSFSNSKVTLFLSGTRSAEGDCATVIRMAPQPSLGIHLEYSDKLARMVTSKPELYYSVQNLARITVSLRQAR